MRNTKEEHLKKWVITGYGAIIIVVTVTIVYVSTLLVRVWKVGDEYNPTTEKIKIVTGTLLRLQECEAEVLFAIASGDAGKIGSEFEQKLDDIHGFLGLLREQTTDSVSFSRIEEIETLLNLKIENTVQLISTRLELEQLYARSLESEMREKRTKILSEDIKTYNESQTVDTLIMNRPQRGFLKRLAEVFTPAKGDTAKRTNTVNTQNMDSQTKEYDPNIAVSEALNNLQRNIIKSREILNTKLMAQSANLLQNNQTITLKINQILNDIKDEETQIAIEQEAQRQLFIDTSLKNLAIISIISLAVILCFLTLILRDISKARRLRLQLERAKQFAEELLISREKLMLMISHDIRAPLSSILSSAELIRNTGWDNEQKEYIDNMSVSAKHTLSLVNDLLDFHRLESGKIEMQQQPFNSVKLFEEIYSCFKPISDAKGLRFELNMEGDGKSKLYIGDPLRIKQAIGNLLSNAVKFTSQGSVYMNVEITQSDGDEAQLSVSVKDEGPGIAKEEQEKIFREFTRLVNSETTEGFGLGLSISSKLISLMNGTISLESELGQGTTFIVKMALRQASEQEISDFEEKIIPDSFTAARQINCLIIDDDPIQLKYMEMLLKHNNINAIPCSGTNEVMDLLKNTFLDFIITDMQMPNMDGVSLLNLVRESNINGSASVPVIAVSASSAEKEEFYKGKGFYGYLSKPITAQALVQKIKTLLDSYDIIETIDNRPVDFSGLTSFAGNSEEAEMIIKTFIAETNKNLELLYQSLQSGDHDSASKLAHKLIPTMAILSEKETVDNLTQLEVNYMYMDEKEWKSRLNSCIQRIMSITKQ